MGTRQDPVDEATRRAKSQVAAVIRDGRAKRISLGISQRRLAESLGCSRQLVGVLESGGLDDVGTLQLARYCAALGLDLPIRTFPGGTHLRDIGQVRLIGRLRAAIGDAWRVSVEVPVHAGPMDRRAVDVVLACGRVRVGVEAITRFADSQDQARTAILKQVAAGLDVMVLVLSDTRHNRAAVQEAAAVLSASFPIGPRPCLAALRAGRPPARNGIVLI